MSDEQEETKPSLEIIREFAAKIRDMPKRIEIYLTYNRKAKIVCWPRRLTDEEMKKLTE